MTPKMHFAIRKSSLNLLTLGILMMTALPSMSLWLPVVKINAAENKSLALSSSLLELQQIQELNRQSDVRDNSKAGPALPKDLTDIANFDSIGQTNPAASVPNPMAELKQNLGLQDVANTDANTVQNPNIWNILGGVKAQAQTNDPFLSGFDQGDVELPWTIGQDWQLTLSYNQGAHLDFPPTSNYLLNFARGGEANTFNQPVLAMSNGIVVDQKLGCDPQGSLGCNNYWGNYVVLQVAPGKYVGYDHLSLISTQLGQQVVRGQEIGRSGASGYIIGGSNIQVGLLDKPHNQSGARSFAMPTVRGTNLTKNETPIADFTGRTGDWFRSSNTQGNFDADGDGISNTTDNCPYVANPDQKDSNGDGVGDACDKDGDKVDDKFDNCAPPQNWDGTGLNFFFNPDQKDSNKNGVGDTCDSVDCANPAPGLSDVTRTYLCDSDYDKDGVANGQDNCPFVSNPDQADGNKNGRGDACDPEARLERFLFNPKVGYYRNMGYNIPIGTVGDPINSSTGNFFREETDVAMTGPAKGVLEGLEPELNLPVGGLKFNRIYNSADQRLGVFGKGWSSDALTYLDFYQTRDSNNQPKAQFGVSVTGGNTDLFERNSKNCPADNSDPGCYSFTVPGESTGTTASLSYQNSGTFGDPKLAWAEACPYLPGTNLSPEALNNYNQFKADLAKYGIQFSNSPNATGGQLNTYAVASAQRTYPDCANFLYTDKFGNQTLYHWDTMTDTDPRNDWKAGLPIFTKYRDGQIALYEFGADDASQVAANLSGQASNAQRFSLLKSISNNFGQKLDFKFTNGLLSAITDNSGRVWTYKYDLEGKLIGVTKPGQATYKYAYNSLGLMTQINDPSGRKILWNRYDANSRVVEQKDAKGQSTKIQYNFDAGAKFSKKTVFTLRDGRKQIHYYDQLGRLIQQTDQNGNSEYYKYKDNSFAKTEEKDKLGRISKYEYDAQDNPVKITLPDGSVTQNTFNQFSQLTQKQQGERITKLEYDGNRLMTKTLPGGATLKYEWIAKDFGGLNQNLTDQAKAELPAGLQLKPTENAKFYVLDGFTDARQNKQGWQYNPQNFVSATQNPDGGSAKFEYDVIGKLTKRISPTGGATTITYDGRDNIIRSANSLGGVTAYGYVANDLLDYKLEPSGLLSIYNYDPNKKLTLSRQCLNLSETSAKSLLTDPKALQNEVNSCRSKLKYDALYEVNSPRGKQFDSVVAGQPEPSLKYDHYDTTFAYDAEDRLVASTDSEGRLTQYQLNAVGQRVKVINPDGSAIANTYDAVSNLTSSTDETGVKTSFGYDSLNRKVKTTRADGKVQTMVYNQFGDLTGVTDYDGASMSMAYDARGNLLSQTDKLGRITKFAYDAADNLVQKEDAAGNKFGFEYNAVNKLSAATYPNGLQIHYAYNSSGQPVRTENWDVRGEAKLISSQASEYDAAGNLIKTINSLGGSQTYGYDSAMRVVESSNYLGNLTGLVGTSKVKYDVLGRVVASTDALDNTSKTAYNPTGLVLLSTDKRGNATQNQYDSRGNLIRQTNALGNSREFSWNPDQTLSCVSDFKTVENQFLPGNQDKFEQFAFETQRLPDTGKLLNGKQTKCLEYDKLKRVVKVTDELGQATAYGYDANGSIVRSVNPKGQITTFKYDKNGNLTETTDAAGAVTKLKYDVLSRVVAVTNAKNQTTVFGYDQVGHQTTQILPNSKDGNSPLEGWQSKTDGVVSKDEITKLRSNGASVVANEFNVLGSLIRTTDANGQSRSYEYNTAQLPVKDIDAIGQATTLEYDGLGRLVSKTYPTGSSEKSSYDALNRVISSVNTYGGATSYEYDSNGNRTLEITPLGNKIVSQYDQLNRLIKVSDSVTGEQPAQTLEYDQNGRVTKAADSQGNQTLNRYDPLGRVIQTLQSRWDAGQSSAKFGDKLRPAANSLTSKSYIYDAASNLVGSADELGGKTAYDYNSQNRLIKITLPDGSATQLNLDLLGNLTKATDAENRATSYALDGQNRVTAITDARGGQTKMDYDPAGNITQSTDPNGNKTAIKYQKFRNYLPAEVTDALGYKQSYGYDALERLTRQTDKKGNTTSWNYNDAGRTVSVTMPEGLTQTESLNPLGQIVTQTKPNGAVYGFEYDSRGRQTRQTNPDGGQIKTEYDSLNRHIKSINPLEGETGYQYDPQGNLVAQFQPDGETSYALYDAKNRKTADILPTTKRGVEISFNSPLEGWPKAEVDSGIAAKTYSYDAVDNLTQTTDPYGAKTRVKYDKVRQPVETINALNNSTKYQYDATGNLTQITDALGGIQKYEYDANSNLVKSIDPNGNATSFAYSSRNQLTERTDALNRTQKFTYDQNGNELSWTKADGVVRMQDFDGLNRLKVRIYQDKDKYPAAPGKFAFEYNKNSDLTRVSQDCMKTCQPELVSGSPLEYAYQYDNMGRMTQQTVGAISTSPAPAGAAFPTTTYKYDQASNLIQESVSQNGKPLQTNSFSYTKGGKTSKANQIELKYDPAGLLTQRLSSGNASDNYSYDLMGRITSFTTSGDDKSPAGFKDRQYDVLGRATEQSNLMMNKTEKYSYDALDRLTSYEYPSNKQEYSYDKAGNRTMLKTNGQKTEYKYDAANQLVSASPQSPNKQITYAYDPNGNRTEIKQGDKTVEKDVYDAENSLIKSTQTAPVNGNGQPTATVETLSAYDFLQRPIAQKSNTTYDKPGNGVGANFNSLAPSDLTITYRQFTYDRLTQTKTIPEIPTRPTPVVNTQTPVGAISTSPAGNDKSKSTPNINSQDKNKNCPDVPSATCNTVGALPSAPSATSPANNNTIGAELARPSLITPGQYTAVMLTNPVTRQLLGTTVTTPDWDKLTEQEKQLWTFNLHTDLQNTTHQITQTNNNRSVLTQSFDPFGQTNDSKLDLGSLNNAQIKSKEDILALGVPIPGYQGSTQQSSATTSTAKQSNLNFGRRTFDPTTATFTTQDPITNGVSYDPFGNQGVAGVSHSATTGNPYTLGSQNPTLNREWDGYISGMSINLQSLTQDKTLQNTNQISNSSNTNPTQMTRTVTETIKVRHVYTPSWQDYASSPEKKTMDNLESQIAFASICKTDTTYPYGCNSYHSQIAENYNLSISPNIKGFADYQKAHSYVYYTYETRSYEIKDTMTQLALTGSDGGYCVTNGFTITLKCGGGIVEMKSTNILTTTQTTVQSNWLDDNEERLNTIFGAFASIGDFYNAVGEEILKNDLITNAGKNQSYIFNTALMGIAAYDDYKNKDKNLENNVNPVTNTVSTAISIQSGSYIFEGSVSAGCTFGPYGCGAGIVFGLIASGYAGNYVGDTSKQIINGQDVTHESTSIQNDTCQFVLGGMLVSCDKDKMNKIA